jgi:FkbM family methyltransferase
MRLLGFQRPSFGLEGLDWKVIDIIKSESKYFIELGANDGVTQSNTLALEAYYGWRGLLIEPIEDTFLELERNRNSRRNTVLRAACVSSEYSEATVNLVFSNLMSTAIGLDSDVGDPLFHATSGARFLRPGQQIRVETAPALTLTQALNSARAPKQIGLLSLDVEGAELEVLKGLNFEEFHCEWILLESRRVDRVSQYLATHGFQLEHRLSSHDYLYSNRLKLSR